MKVLLNCHTKPRLLYSLQLHVGTKIFLEKYPPVWESKKKRELFAHSFCEHSRKGLLGCVNSSTEPLLVCLASPLFPFNKDQNIGTILWDPILLPCTVAALHFTSVYFTSCNLLCFNDSLQASISDHSKQAPFMKVREWKKRGRMISWLKSVQYAILY